MKVLIVGGGGREHALAWKAAQSPLVSHVYVAPGNAGTAREPRTSNVPISATDLPALVEFALKEQISLTIVGPEAALVAGIVDRFTEVGLKCFGPSQAAAQLEGSKAFSKEFLARHQIPTAYYALFTELDEAERYLREAEFPQVIKADGLAAGKGVMIVHSVEEGIEVAREMLTGEAHGQAGHRIVIEQFLRGEEASYIVMVDGKHVVPMATSQDHKARFAADEGPNTGGMGAYSPAPVVTPEMDDLIMRTVIKPTVEGMAADGNLFRGFLYAGVMIDEQGTPYVLEFNTRMGDPETQPIMLRMKSDLVELCLAAIEGTLDRCHAEWDPRVSLGVVMVNGEYPDEAPSGRVISGLDRSTPEGTKVFYASAQEGEQGEVIASGGRVLCVCALGESTLEAQQAAYAEVSQIKWEGVDFRPDIGYRAIARES
jgi:phosphoribosylamine--glycine ligase